MALEREEVFAKAAGLVALSLVALVSLPLLASAQEPERMTRALIDPVTAYGDTTDATRRVRRAMGRRQYDAIARGPIPRQLWETNEPWVAEGECSADRGQRCFGVDPELGPTCLTDVDCDGFGMDWGLAEMIVAEARANPHSGFVVGYAVYSRMKSGELAEALELARLCEAVAWWCGLLEGYAHQGAGRVVEADRAFERALELAPEPYGCLLTDASWTLPGRERERMRGLPCETRVARSDTIWWLADPLWTIAGNDRLTEQVSRTMKLAFFIQSTARLWDGGLMDWQFERPRESVLPRGIWDSWRWIGPTAPAWSHWTSRKAARYHFVPDFEDGDLSKPVWRLEATLDDEGYTPGHGTFHELPVQIARFGRGDSMLVAVASTVHGTPLTEQPDASAHLILSDGPGRFPVELTSALHDERAVFLAQTPRQRYVTSLEVLSEGVYGQHRVLTQGLEGAVSDLLLYDPVGTHLPEELKVAVGMMRGTTVVELGERPGLYWEVYGAPEGTPVRIELAVESEGRGGVIGWLGGLFGGGDGHRGSWSWEEASPGEAVFAKAIHLDLGELTPGAYTLALRASWPGQDEPVETRRAFEVR